MKKNCIFIIPYFGKFNNYFQLFLNSCSTNENYNWLILTDDDGKYDYPKNVEVANSKRNDWADYFWRVVYLIIYGG